MALGLTNAPFTYSRLMDLVLSGLTYSCCLVYLDDTIIFSRTFEDHFTHLNDVLQRIVDVNFKLRPEKCEFAAERVKHLGYVITPEGVMPDINKVKVILEMEFPKTPKGMIRVLGALNFYSELIPRYSEIASVLYKMSQSNSKYKSKMKSPEAMEAFEKLKKMFRGSSNYTDDMLSRIEYHVNSVQVQFRTAVNLGSEQRNDALISKVIDLVNEGADQTGWKSLDHRLGEGKRLVVRFK